MRRSLLAVLLLAAPQASFAWGVQGHKLVARVANAMLSAKAKAEVARLLEPGETLESVSAWADEVRPRRRNTGPWHYINIPITAGRGPLAPFCPEEGCVVRAIEQMVARLSDPQASREAKAEALKFLVHFVGDLHQPLHAGDSGDRGGNDVAVVFFNHTTNLHSIWDTPLLEALVKRNPQFAARPWRGVGRVTRQKHAAGTPADWAWESQELSKTVAYANLPAASPALLGEGYQAKALPVIRLQIQRAGVRLATLLNGIW
jgi:hypothetical protein